MTPSELYAINFQNPEPSYYARIPHILDHLTYDSLDKETGKVVKKRLSVYGKELYRIIKAIAGEKGACWMTSEHIAKKMNVSKSAMLSAKKELCQKFDQLDGNPLISITVRSRKTETYGAKYHVLTINDIWKWNNAYMATLRFHKEEEESDGGARSLGDQAGGARSLGDQAPQGAWSLGDLNKNNKEQEQLSKEQQPASDVSFVSSDKEKLVFPTDVGKQKIWEWLLEIGCHKTTAKRMVDKYSQDDFIEASAYVKKMCAKNPKTNKLGYLQTTLKNRYWEKAK